MFISEFIQERLGLKGPMPFEPLSLRFEKKSFVTKIKDIENHVYFLQKGIVEVGIHKEGDEKIIDFVFAGQFFSSYTSFLLRKPSDVYITCLTECMVEAIPYEVLQEAYKVSLLANQFGRIITETAFMERVKREKDFLSKSAEERYLELIERRPEVIQLIPGGRIAKYLGIHPESLSRIRKAIS
jgi:CRP-like cAMP-binding protein